MSEVAPVHFVNARHKINNLQVNTSPKTSCHSGMATKSEGLDNQIMFMVKF